MDQQKIFFGSLDGFFFTDMGMHPHNYENVKLFQMCLIDKHSIVVFDRFKSTQGSQISLQFLFKELKKLNHPNLKLYVPQMRYNLIENSKIQMEFLKFNKNTQFV